MPNSITHAGWLPALPHPESRLARMAIANVPYVAL